MFRTIHSKFILLTILFILLSVGIPTLFLILQFKENFRQRSEIMLESTLDTFLSGLDNIMVPGEVKNVQHIINKISRNRTIDHMRVFNDANIILYSSDTTEVGKDVNIVAPGHIRAPVNKKSIFLIKNKNIYSITIPIENKPACQRCHGEVLFIANLDLDTDLTRAEINFYTGSVHIIFLAIAIVLVLSVGFYLLFSYFINKPLTHFITNLNAVKAGNLTREIPVKSNDEFGVLQQHFNSMIRSLRKSNKKIEELHSEQLRRADKLVTLGELAAEMAHEINNPAGIIMSRADYLLLAGENKPELKEFREDLEVILKQVEKISGFTGNVLKYGKKFPTELQKFDLVQTVNESIEILSPRLKKTKIKIIKNFEKPVMAIIGLSHQIEQVLINLINNSIDAMESSGNLTITIAEIRNGRTSLSITDSGKGIENHIREQIFTPFFTTKSPDKGTGLGLYIVKNICKNHKADLTCESTPGEGTTFTIIFNQKQTKA
ncbi:MAG: sensor histidine kinase [Calditrichales bacterium]|nr:MAG: sensor histidine kinase [Calditrichales bacterium]